MDSNVCWIEDEESRLMREDEARMQELKRLFDLIDEREQRQKEISQLEIALDVLSWEHVARALDHALDRALRVIEPKPHVDYIELHRQWLKAFRSAMPYLAKMLLVTDASLLIKLRRTLNRYAEISYPNLLIVIQPKLQTLNSIKA